MRKVAASGIASIVAVGALLTGCASPASQGKPASATSPATASPISTACPTSTASQANTASASATSTACPTPTTSAAVHHRHHKRRRHHHHPHPVVVPTPSSAPPPAPSTAPAQPAAWCTASAVYNSQYNDYDVYVHSNQPHQTATATASNGKSWSYETNGSGYADIYLYADPGNSITVTVGQASCSTTAG